MHISPLLASLVAVLLQLQPSSTHAEDAGGAVSLLVAPEEPPPGIPGIEFLGLGYDLVSGNPRGTSTSELDPGFRHRVIHLNQGDEGTTIDGAYSLPDHVSAMTAASCKFDSKSVELSNEETYREELSKESEYKTTIGASGDAVIKGVPVSASLKVAFGSSESFNNFKEKTTNTQTVTYEAKAVCTEFDLKLDAYHEHAFFASFERSFKALPEQFDECDEANRDAYFEFIETFGTHLVTGVVLGAKYIVSTEMKATEVMELTKEKVDIASSLSIDASVGIGKSANEAAITGADKAKKSGDSDSDDDDDVEAIYKVIFPNAPTALTGTPAAAPANPANVTPAATPAPASSPVGASFSFGFDKSSKSSTSTDQYEKISKSVTQVTEITIGGRPPEDRNWVEWAASVKERPMPVKLQLKGIFEFFETEDQAKNYFQAVLAKTGQVLDLEEQLSDYVNAMHYGSFTSGGRPISSYSTSPQANYRTLMTPLFPDVTDGTDDAEALKLVDNHDIPVSRWRPITSCPTAQFVCGVKVWQDVDTNTIFVANDEAGTVGLELKCCPSVGNVAHDSIFTDVRVEPSISRADFRDINKWNGRGGSDSIDVDIQNLNCPPGAFVVGAQARYYGIADSSTDPDGLNGLRILCSDDPSYLQRESTSPSSEGAGIWSTPKLASNGRIATGARLRFYESPIDEEFYGVTDIEFQFSEPPVSFYSYEALWSGSKNVVSAFFATVVGGVIVPSGAETALTFNADYIDQYKKGTFSPFGVLNSADPSIARFGVNFQSASESEEDLQSFSFLSADNLERDDNMIVGVVHPDGYALNKLFGLDKGFEVSMPSVKNDFLLTMNNKDSCESPVSDQHPTVVLFPLWLGKGMTDIPSTMQATDVSLKHEYWKGTTDEPSCANGIGDGILINAKTARNDRSLGFSFLFLDYNVRSKGLYHGYVEENSWSACPNMNDSIPGVSYCLSGTETILMKFDDAFEDVPAVIVTPVEDDTYDVDSSGSHFMMAEDVTRSGTRIRAGRVSGNDAYRMTGFTFVVAGAPNLGGKPTRKSECPNYIIG